MARLDDNWQIVELSEITETEKKSDTGLLKRQLELLEKVDTKKISGSDRNGTRRNKHDFNA